MRAAVTSFFAQPRRLALALSAASLLVWWSWYALHPNRHPFGDLSQGSHTDHFSHLNAARLFPRVGLDIWRKPVQALVVPLTQEEMERLPDDLRPFAGPGGGVFKVPGWPLTKTFISSWPQYPRPYPPGDLVLVAPFAALYHFGRFTFSQMNRILIFYFIFLAHVTIYFATASFLRYRTTHVIGLLGLVLCYGELIHWSLEGFYDVAFVGPLILSFGLLLAGDRPAALAAYAGATFIHFRALFCAPIAIYAIAAIIARREWKSWSRREFGLIAAAVVLGSVTLYTFGLLWPWLRQVPISNQVGLRPDWPSPTFLAFALLSSLVGVALAWSRAWADLGVLCWMILMWVSTPYIFYWYMLAMVPWVMAGSLWSKPESGGLVRDARLLFFLFVSVLVCSYAPVFAWLRQVF